MIRKDSVNYSKGKLTVGYGVIGLLIGAIVFLYSSEWRQLEKLEHVSTVYVSHRKYAYKLVRSSVQYSSPIQVNIVSLFDESSSKVYRIRTMDERFKTGAYGNVYIAFGKLLGNVETHGTRKRHFI